VHGGRIVKLTAPTLHRSLLRRHYILVRSRIQHGLRYSDNDSSNPLASCKSALTTPPAIPSRQLCAVGLNGRTWKISFSVRGCTAEAGTMTTAIVSPTALNTSSA
jgi:hypothetical protein